MSLRLPKIAQQLLAVGLLAVALALATLLVVVPTYDGLLSLQSQIEQQRLVLGHALLPRDDDSERLEIDRIAGAEQTGRLTLTGESDAIRMANLQSMVGGIATAAGVQLRSTRNLTPREQGDVRLVGVQLQFTATIAQVQTMLVAIEAQRPYLLIDGLQITALQDFARAGTGATADSDSGAPASLDTRLDVMGAAARQKG